MNGVRSLITCMRALQQRRRQLFAALQPHARPTRGVALAGVVLLLAIGIYFAYSEHQRRALPRTVNALVLDASARLHDALAEEPEAGAPRTQRLEAHHAAVAEHLLRLRAIDTSAIEEHARAADDYLLTTREILRRCASDYRNRMALTETVSALRVHMRSDNRTGTWVTQAVQRKERLETGFRQYRLTAEALAALLEQYPASRARLAAHVHPAQLTDDARALAARDRALEAVKKSTEEVGRAGQLNAYR